MGNNVITNQIEKFTSPTKKKTIVGNIVYCINCKMETKANAKEGCLKCSRTLILRGKYIATHIIYSRNQEIGMLFNSKIKKFVNIFIFTK